VIGSISTMSDNFIGWGRGNSSASLASSSHKSQRSRKSLDTRSHRSLDTKSIKSSTSSKRGGESLQDGLERIERKTSQSQSFSVKSHKSSSSRRTSTSKQSRGPQKSVKSSMSRSSGQRSCASVSSVSSRRSSTSKRISSAKSVSSQYSSISNISAMSIHTQQTRGIGYLKSGYYRKAIQLFTKAIQSHHDNGDEEQQSSLATIYGYRSEALYELGAYEASTRDARNVLQLYNSDNKRDEQWFGGIFKSSSSSAQCQKLNHEGGEVLRAKALCTLGYSLLRQGHLDEVQGSFKEATNTANKALEDAIDLPVSDRPVDYEQAVISLKETIRLATEGQALFSTYECIMIKLDNSSNKRELQVLDSLVEIAPAAIHLHVKKVNYLIGRRRWFAVANHCEQLAANATKLEGVFRGDLADIDPFPTAVRPRLQELNNNTFNREEATPPHLRILNPVEVCDAVFRIPIELLPYYLRSLRLEERYKGAMLAYKALKDFRDSTNSHADYNFLDNEFDKLKRTMNVKEVADALFRDKQYAQSCIKYGECMSVDDEEVVSILRPASNWPVAFNKANLAGGKLHAVLHSNRAGCFVALGRHHDAIKESSHAIKIHPMYCKALLRRARSYVTVEQRGKAQEDFNQYIRLVNGARDHPNPPYNQGSSCYFNMPSDVSAKQLQDVKDEMRDLGMQPIKTRREESLTMRKLYSALACLIESLCCKSSKSQVVVARKQTEQQPQHWPSSLNNDDLKSQYSTAAKSRDGSVKNDIVTPTKRDRDRRRISFSSDSPPVYKYAPDPPTPDEPTTSVSSSRSHRSKKKQEGLDPSIDYYSILNIAQTATDSEIKRAYHKARQGSHTQDQSDKVEVA